MANMKEQCKDFASIVMACSVEGRNESRAVGHL